MCASQGVLPEGREVVIKRPRGECDIGFPVWLQHENVVTTLGHCLYALGEMVVEEYMPNGTLSEIIKGMFTLIIIDCTRHMNTTVA